MLQNTSEYAPSVKNNKKRYDINQFPWPRTAKHVKWFKRLSKWSKIIWDYNVIGAENVPKNHNYILCPNHQSLLDVLFVLSPIEDKINFKDTLCLIWDEHVKHNFSRFMLKFFGGVPIDDLNPKDGFNRSKELLQSQKYSMVIFPEGALTLNGDFSDFKNGAARLSIESGLPIIPVRIDGAFDIFSRYQKIPKIYNWNKLKRYPIKITFGSLMLPDKYDDVNKMTQAIKNSISDLGRNFN